MGEKFDALAEDVQKAVAWWAKKGAEELASDKPPGQAAAILSEASIDKRKESIVSAGAVDTVVKLYEAVLAKGGGAEGQPEKERPQAARTPSLPGKSSGRDGRG